MTRPRSRVEIAPVIPLRPLSEDGATQLRRRGRLTSQANRGESRLTYGIPQEAVLRHLDWMRLRGRSPWTVYSRERGLLRLAAHFGVEPGDDLLLVTPEDLEAWQGTLSHLSASTRHHYVVNLRDFYAWATRTKLIAENPADALVLAKLPRRKPRPISPEDLQLAIDSATLSRVRICLVLAAYAGLRAAEIAGLLRENVHETLTQPVMIVLGKGDKERVIPLSRRVVLELQTYEMPARGPILRRLDGNSGPVAPWTVSNLCNRHLHGLGIEETLHSLRHFFGTQMYAVSQDIRMVQEVMGHESPLTTATYVAWSQPAAAAAVEAITNGGEAR